MCCHPHFILNDLAAVFLLLFLLTVTISYLLVPLMSACVPRHAPAPITPFQEEENKITVGPRHYSSTLL